MQNFITDVFWNMDQILAYHRRMLSEFFERQREQHPLVQSVADIVLDSTSPLLFLVS
jgi:RHO1 GDP-GTP exchange protein 1/2